MILPLLCASLIASAAGVPSFFSQNDDYFNESLSVSKNEVLVDDVTQSLPFSHDGSFDIYLKFPYGSYNNVAGEPFSISSDMSFSQGFPNVGDCSFNIVGLSEPFSFDNFEIVFEEDFWSLQATFHKQDDVWDSGSIQNFYLEASFGDRKNFCIDCSFITDQSYVTDLLFSDSLWQLQYVPSDFVYYPLPVASVDGVEVVGEIVSILGAGIGQLGSSIGQGISTFAQSLAFDGNGNLSIYFIMVISLASVSLAIALTTRLFSWLTTLGN